MVKMPSDKIAVMSTAIYHASRSPLYPINDLRSGDIRDHKLNIKGSGGAVLILFPPTTGNKDGIDIIMAIITKRQLKINP